MHCYDGYQYQFKHYFLWWQRATLSVRGSLTFSITYIHTQNITAFYIEIKLETLQKGHFDACCSSAPPAIPPTTAALNHNQYNKNRPLALSAAAPILSRLEIYLETPLYRHPPSHPPGHPMPPLVTTQLPSFKQTDGNYQGDPSTQFKFK